MSRLKYKIDDKGRECAECGIYKPWSEFHKNRGSLTGHASYCKVCRRGLVQPRSIYRIDENGRECTKCKQYKLLSEFYVAPTSLGRRSRCKTCIRKGDQEREQRTPRTCHIDDKGRECTQCNKYKLWSEFYVSKGGTRGYTSQCKPCTVESKFGVERRQAYTPAIKRYVNDNGRECVECEEYKPWSEFNKCQSEINGYASCCKVCAKIRYIRRKEAKGQRVRQQCLINDEGRECTGCNKFKPWSAFRKGDGPNGYRSRCRECCIEAEQIKREESRKNGTYVRKQLYGVMSRGVNHSLTWQGQSRKKKRRWEMLVGYTAVELKAHLEARWQPGMSWDNYGRGGWHIDHIIPVDSFCIESAESENFKRCWALSNLQPLWEADNIRKSNRLDWKPSAQAAG